MDTTTIRAILDKNNIITNMNENIIELMYDLGNSADAEYFENNFDDILNIYPNLEVSLDVFEDPAYADLDGEEYDFHVGSVIIEYSTETDFNMVKNFLDKVDTI